MMGGHSLSIVGKLGMWAISLLGATLLLATLPQLFRPSEMGVPSITVVRQSAALSQPNNNSKKLFSADQFLKDRSIKLSPRVDRLWMDYDGGDNNNNNNNNNNSMNQSGVLSSSSASSSGPIPPPRPPAKILLTSYGWNHHNQTIGLTFGRSTRSREFLQAIVDHPWFDLTGWDDILSGKQKIDQSLRYYVFLDVETCFECNYPYYGRWTNAIRYQFNSDLSFGRQMQTRDAGYGPCTDILTCYNTTIQQVLATPLFQQVPSAPSDSHGSHADATTASAPLAKLVYLECTVDPRTSKFRKQVTQSPALALVRISVARDDLQPEIDQGLAPPPIQPLHLSPLQVHNIETCMDDNDDDDNNQDDQNPHRPYLLTFFGSPRRGGFRDKLAKIDNGRDIVIRLTGMTASILNETNLAVGQEIMMRSQFVASPRGGGLFSYRFTEALSAGAIPVVYADGWVLPFRPELIHWERDCVVRIPQRNVSDTEVILRAMAPHERCRRRRRCYEIYRTYLSSAEGVIGGIIEGLELVARNVTQ